MASPSKWSGLETLRGLTLEERKSFSWDNLRHFYRVTLWDRSHTCKLCGKDITSISKATLDHIIPKSLGGKFRLCNLQLAHKRCNSEKSNFTYGTTRNDALATQSLKRFTPRSL